MTQLQGKVIWITGALGSLGRSGIRMFLKRGAAVYATDIVPIEGFPEIQRLGVEAGEERFVFRQADVCDEASVTSVIADVEQRFGRLDGLLHTVYTNVWKPALELTLTEWEDTLRGTLTSTFLVNKHAIELMIRSGGGSIVNTSSILGEIVSPGCLAYGAGKAGVNQFTRVVAADYGSYGIRANVLVPGDFSSDERLAEQSDQAKEAMKRLSWIGRSGRADEICETAAFLLSDAASYITGALFRADGGFHQ